MTVKTILWATLLIALFCACSKDNDTKSESQHLRIKQIISNEDGTTSKTTFSYEDNKITTINFYAQDENEEWISTGYKNKITYTDNEITTNYYYYSNNDWQSEAKLVYKLSNNQIIKEYYYELSGSTWINYEAYEYAYSGSQLTHWKYSAYNDGSLKNYYKGEFTYEDSYATKYFEYSFDDDTETYEPYYKEIFFYNDSKLDNYTTYYYSSTYWEKSAKYEFDYSGDKVSEMTLCLWHLLYGEWVDYIVYSYTYNENDLITYYELTKASTATYEYEYEEGTGNAEILLNNIYGSNYNMPTLKSTNSEISNPTPQYRKERKSAVTPLK